MVDFCDCHLRGFRDTAFHNLLRSARTLERIQEIFSQTIRGLLGNIVKIMDQLPTLQLKTIYLESAKLELPGNTQSLNLQCKNHHQLELLMDLDRRQARLDSRLGSQKYYPLNWKVELA